MKTISFVLTLLLATISTANAQTTVAKSPGDPTTVSFTYTATATGFLLQSAPSATSATWVDGVTIGPTARQFPFPAPAVPTFYRVIALNGTSRSAPSNVVDVSIIPPVPPAPIISIQ